MPKRNIAATLSDQTTHMTFTVFQGLNVLCAGELSSRQGAHAEDRFIDEFLPQNAHNLAPPPAVNLCMIGLNRSPCTSVARDGYPTTSNKTNGKAGCIERLSNLISNGFTHNGVTYRFTMIVSIRNLYGGDADAEAASSNAMGHYAQLHNGALEFDFQRRGGNSSTRFLSTGTAKKLSM